MDKPLDYIFIDTSILKMESYFKESGRVTKLFDLASKGYVKILLPIITKNEWLKHIKEATNIKFDNVERKILLFGNVKEASSITENLRQFSSEYLKFVEDSIALQLSKGNVIEIDYDFLWTLYQKSLISILINLNLLEVMEKIKNFLMRLF